MSSSLILLKRPESGRVVRRRMALQAPLRLKIAMTANVAAEGMVLTSPRCCCTNPFHRTTLSGKVIKP